MTICEKAETILNGKSRLIATGIENNGNKIRLRLFKSRDGDVCFYRKGSKKFGYRLSSLGNLIDIVPVTSRKTTEQKWITGWKKARARLEKSGLWKELIDEIDIALEVGYEKMNEAYKKYWEIQDENEKLSYIRAISEKLITKDSENKDCCKSSLIWHYAKLPKIEKMYFGKYRNDFILENIRKGLEQKKKTSESAEAGYDVSFEYNPEANKAWFSKEFRGCGNGHYYLVLDATHVIFYEDD